MNIGFIGYGEAAFNISLGLKGEGVKGIRANDAMMNHEVMGKQVTFCSPLCPPLSPWMFATRSRAACVLASFMWM